MAKTYSYVGELTPVYLCAIRGTPELEVFEVVRSVRIDFHMRSHVAPASILGLSGGVFPSRLARSANTNTKLLIWRNRGISKIGRVLSTGRR